MSDNHFEDFAVGKRFRHPTPRTVTEGDASLYIALTGARHPLPCSTPLASAQGYRARPIDDLLTFNIAFGKTVGDVSVNAIANLGYADLRFLEPVYAGDTIRAETTVLGLRETSSGDSGVVYVRSDAYNQQDRAVMTWARWVLVRKRDKSAASPASETPVLPDHVAPEQLVAPPPVDAAAMADATGSPRFWQSFEPGERIDHPAGMTLEESDHMLATRLYQNNAQVHFDQMLQAGSQHGRRLVYGGHVISICRALSFDGLENAMRIMAINAGAHRAPCFAGDTITCFTEVLERIELPGRRDVGALRLRLVGLKNQRSAGFVDRIEESGKVRFHPDVVLDLDYTVAVPRTA